MLVQLQRLTTHSSRLRLVIMGRYRVLTALAGVPYRCWSLSGAMKKGEVASDADGADWQPCQRQTTQLCVITNHAIDHAALTHVTMHPGFVAYTHICCPASDCMISCRHSSTALWY